MRQGAARPRGGKGHGGKGLRIHAMFIGTTETDRPGRMYGFQMCARA